MDWPIRDQASKFRHNLLNYYWYEYFSTQLGRRRIFFVGTGTYTFTLIYENKKILVKGNASLEQDFSKTGMV
jgi:hypothetical protein